MEFNDIHHIAIICSDYDIAKDFYVNKLGFEVVRENYRAERDDWKIDLRLNETTELELFIMKGRQRHPTPEANGLRHLAFRVDDVSTTVKELEKVGIICEPIRRDNFTGDKMTFFHDSDNQPIEIHE